MEKEGEIEKNSDAIEIEVGKLNNQVQNRGGVAETIKVETIGNGSADKTNKVVTIGNGSADKTNGEERVENGSVEEINADTANKNEDVSEKGVSWYAFFWNKYRNVV